jgi:hypothetical protein
MKKIFFLLNVLLIASFVEAQTGIGTTTPNASAKLDVFSDTKGFLPPRVALTSTSSFSPVTGLSGAPALLTAAGLLVYNTANVSNVTPGFYYWNGTSWIRLIVPTDNASNVTGTVAVANGGTGTTTGSITGTGALTFTAGGSNQNINLTPSGTGNVGIGASSPAEKLEVNGNVKATNFIGTASSATLYLLEANADVTYTMPGSYTNDLCRYSIVNTYVNVPSSWFNTSTYRFTPQKAGYWEITASYDIYRNSESSLSIQKNGNSVAVAGTLSSVVQQIRKIVYLNGSTDYINIANNGSSSNARAQDYLKSWFQARWVGE